jgi:hypothetical protein
MVMVSSVKCLMERSIPEEMVVMEATTAAALVGGGLLAPFYLDLVLVWRSSSPSLAAAKRRKFLIYGLEAQKIRFHVII